MVPSLSAQPADQSSYLALAYTGHGCTGEKLEPHCHSTGKFPHLVPKYSFISVQSLSPNLNFSSSPLPSSFLTFLPLRGNERAVHPPQSQCCCQTFSELNIKTTREVFNTHPAAAAGIGDFCRQSGISQSKGLYFAAEDMRCDVLYHAKEKACR